MFKVGDLVVYNPHQQNDWSHPHWSHPHLDVQNKSAGLIVELVAEHLYAVRWLDHPHIEIVGEDAGYAVSELTLLKKAAPTNF